MGCDHFFYVLPRLSYAKFIKPKLIQYYGLISRFAILRQEQKRKEQAELLENIFKGDLASIMMGKRREVKETPFKKFFKSKKSSEYYGQQNQELFDQIWDLLQKKSIYHYDERNSFLRADSFMPYIDLFEQTGVKIKVSNMDQVENFIHYIEVVKKVYGEEDSDSSLAQSYDNCSQAGQVFKEVLKKMKGAKKETVLLLKSSG